MAGAAAKPSWQTIPVGVDQRGVFFAAGRAWYYSGIESGNFKAKSARVANGQLTGWTTATLPVSRGWGLIGPHGQELVLDAGRDGLQAVKLLPTGASVGDGTSTPALLRPPTRPAPASSSCPIA